MPQDLLPKDTTPIPGGSLGRHQIAERMTHRGSIGIKAITFLNSLATGVLWNGLGFITSNEFHYSASQTYALYIVTGAVYAFSALYCGRLVRRFERKLNARKVMMILFLIQVLVAPMIYFDSSSFGLIVIAIVTSFTGACLWPIIESYVAAGRSAQQTRKAIGQWCIVWMTSVSLALFLMAPLQQNEGWMNPRLALFAILPMSLLSMACLWFVPSHPGHHHAPAEEAPADYNSHLKSARILLPASYLLVGALSPLMPYLLDRLKLEATSETPLTSVWLSTRVVVVALMAHISFWHGRWSTLLAGSILLASGFAIVVTIPSMPFIVIGLALFGAGHGIIYYAALYYALRVGSAGIDAGGMHEALIGLGYVVGPAAGLCGFLLGGGGWTVAIVWGLLAIAAIPAVLPFFDSWRQKQKMLSSNTN